MKSGTHNPATCSKAKKKSESPWKEGRSKDIRNEGKKQRKEKRNRGGGKGAVNGRGRARKNSSHSKIQEFQ